MEQNSSFNDIRRGRFTSSEIWRLCGYDRTGKSPSAQFYSYCKQVASERLFGARIISGGNIQTEYGKLTEKYIGKELEQQGYTYGFSDIPIVNNNPEFTEWHSGTPDYIVKSTVGDIKCPFSCEKYFDLYGINEEVLKKDKPEYYWQLISNSILTGKQYAELTAFYPTFDDLQAILELNRQESISFKMEWADIDNLPFLGEGKEDMRIYRLNWFINNEDSEFLYDRLRHAISYTKELIETKLKLIKK